MEQVKKIEKIRANYMPREKNKYDELNELNKKVKRPVEIFAYIFGSISSLILGSGMCLVMPDVIEGMMLPGIIVGVIGMGLCAINWFIYKKALASRKKKYADKIIALSNELLNI